MKKEEKTKDYFSDRDTESGSFFIAIFIASFALWIILMILAGIIYKIDNTTKENNEIYNSSESINQNSQYPQKIQNPVPKKDRPASEIISNNNFIYSDDAIFIEQIVRNIIGKDCFVEVDCSGNIESTQTIIYVEIYDLSEKIEKYKEYKLRAPINGEDNSEFIELENEWSYIILDLKELCRYIDFRTNNYIHTQIRLKNYNTDECYIILDDTNTLYKDILHDIKYNIEEVD